MATDANENPDKISVFSPHLGAATSCYSSKLLILTKLRHSYISFN